MAAVGTGLGEFLNASGDGTPDDDEGVDDLIRRTGEGDVVAFRLLYQRYFDCVFAYARMMLRDSYAAEDVTQEVFTRALQCITRGEVLPGTPLRAWLFRVARNMIIDSWRRSARIQYEDPAALERLQEQTGPDLGPDMQAWVNDSYLWNMLRRLTIAQRDVLFLRFGLDLPTDEIAAVLDRTPKAVRLLHWRALRSLEQWMAPSGGYETHRERMASLLAVRPAPVMAARRFALFNRRPGMVSAGGARGR